MRELKRQTAMLEFQWIEGGNMDAPSIHDQFNKWFRNNQEFFSYFEVKHIKVLNYKNCSNQNVETMFMVCEFENLNKVSGMNMRTSNK